MTSGGRCPLTQSATPRPVLADARARPAHHRAWYSLGYFAYVVVESHLYQALENRELDAILATSALDGSWRLRLHMWSRACAHARARLGDRPHRDSAARRLRDHPGRQRRAYAAARSRPHPRHRLSRRNRQHRPRWSSRHVLPPPSRHPDRRRDPDRHARRDVHVQGRKAQVSSSHATRGCSTPPTPVLTLVTCYPFTYVGSAPKRFIVRASSSAEPRRVSLTLLAHCG